MDCLEVCNLNAFYKIGKEKKDVLCNVSLKIEPGQFVCLCGPNGCGKSTLLSVLAGVPDPKLKFEEQRGQTPATDKKSEGTDPEVSGPFQRGQTPPVYKLSSTARAKLLAYMQQSEWSVWDFLVRDYVLQGRFAHSKGGHYTAQDYEIVDSCLNQLNMSAFVNRPVHSLSGGEFQKIRIARALAQTPEFMLLDEPAANLDYVFEPQLMSLLKQISHDQKIGMLISVHNINLAYQLADKILLLPPEKNVLCGLPGDIMTPENLKLTFGVDFKCQKNECFQSLQ